MAVSLFFQGGDGDSGGGGSSGRGGARGGGDNQNVNEDNTVPPPSMGTVGELVDVLRAYGQRVPQELLALGPLSPLVDPPSSGGTTTLTANAATWGGGRAGATTSRMTAITEGGIHWG